jgi:hypothetical protein
MWTPDHRRAANYNGLRYWARPSETVAPEWGTFAS